MKLHPETEQQIIELLRSLELGATHKEARIVGNENSVCIYVEHSAPVMTKNEKGEDVVTARVDANVYPTQKALDDMSMQAKQGSAS